MMKRLHRFACGLVTLSLATGVCTPVALAYEPEAICAQANQAASLSWVRLDGETRYDTMRSIAREAFAKSEWAVIASGENYPDALAASSLAGALSCPVLITPASSLASQTRAELDRLNVRRAYVVGGPSAIGEGVMNAISGMGIDVTRIAGADRAGTSLAVQAELKSLATSGKVSKHADTVVVTNGSSFVGALSISPYAYAHAAPILLTDNNGALTNAQLEAIRADGHVKRVVIVCADGFTGAAVESQLSGSYSIVRLEGEGASGLSANVGSWELSQGLSFQTPVVTRASIFPDALCGSALAGSKNSVMLLVDDLADIGWETLSQSAGSVSSAYVLGGLQATPLIWSGDTELDQIIDSLVAGRDASDPNVLRDLYEYVSSLEYVAGDVYPESDWREWSIADAKEMHRNGGGNCYRYASLMTWICRRLGYAARPISGNTYSSAAELVPHCWVEVKDSGRTLIIDPERHHSMEGYEFFMVTYEEAPIYYFDLDGNSFA